MPDTIAKYLARGGKVKKLRYQEPFYFDQVVYPRSYNVGSGIKLRGNARMALILEQSHGMILRIT